MLNYCVSTLSHDRPVFIIQCLAKGLQCFGGPCENADIQWWAGGRGARLQNLCPNHLRSKA